MTTFRNNPFEIVQIGGDQVQVWIGEPNAAESEFVCQIHIQLVPQLIASLRKVAPMDLGFVA